MIVQKSKQAPVVSTQLQSYWSLLVRYLKPQWPRVSGMAALLLASIALQVANPQIIRYFLDTAQSGGSSRALSLAALVFASFALLQKGVAMIAYYTSQVVSWSATNRLRTDLAQHCMRLDMTFHKEHTPGELIERIDGDVTQMANFLSQFAIRVLGNGLLAAGILVLLFLEDARLGSGMAVYTLAALYLLGLIQRLATPRWVNERAASAELYGFLEERISGTEDIQAAGAGPYMIQRLLALLQQFLEKSREAFVVSSLAQNLSNLVYASGYAIGLTVGVILYLQHQATIGTAYLIVYYVGMLAVPLQGIREQAQDLQQAAASIQRVQELTFLQPTVSDSGRAQKASSITRLPPDALGVSFDKVSFHYEDNENVLEEVSFELPPGRVLGILGRTGSGKSTITRLLFRLYDPTQGAIRLDGSDIRKVPLAELRGRVGMVTQDVQLFQASVRENLTFFDPRITDERLESVLKVLRLWEWVQSLPQGLDTRLAAGGQGISAGEAQLLAFGRVFLKDPGLVILDEASSRLDPSTETRMEHSIDRLFAGRTALIIAHRLKTVQRADDILILENGRAVEYGPRLLLASDPRSRFANLLRTGLEEALV